MTLNDKHMNNVIAKKNTSKDSSIQKGQARRVGVTIKKFRNMKDLTQQQLSVDSGISQEVISKIENGKQQDIKLGTLTKIANALNVPVIALLWLSSDSEEIEDENKRKIYDLIGNPIKNLLETHFKI